MKFNIYDYDNQPKEIDTGDKEINFINVTILSGDEVIKIYYSDGTFEVYDSSENRHTDYFDDSYVVSKENLAKWLESAKYTTATISYNRIY